MKNRPNILLIMSDQHNRRILGCYGNPIVSTPHIDQIAREGVVFDNAYCNYPLCCPSRMSFMTGQEPYAIQAWSNKTMLPSYIPTFAHALGRADYETVLCGRMDFKGPDQRHGFTQRIFPEIGGKSAGELEGANQFNRKSMEKSGPGKNHFLLYDEQCTQAACDWIKDRGAQESAKPFCMVLGLVGPHCPFVCPNDLFHKYYHRVDMPEVSQKHLDGLHPFHQRFRERSRITDLTSEEIRRTRAAYFGMVEFLDTLVGKAVESLKESGLLENTIIIYTSDHGEMAGEHGMWWKFSFFEGSVAVPMIISWPKSFRTGIRVPTNVALTDLAPTLAEWTHAPALPDASGRNLTPLLNGGSKGWKEREIFSECIGDACSLSEGPSGGPARMIRKGNWKCVYYHNEPPALYDLENDPGELSNLANHSMYESILKDLISRILQDWNPDQVLRQFHLTSALHHYVSKAPRPDDYLKGDCWNGPEDYGSIDQEALHQVIHNLQPLGY